MPRRGPWTTRIVSTVLVALLALGVWWLQQGGSEDPAPSREESSASTSANPGATDDASGLPYVEEGSLPPEAAATLELIDRGGPFPYPDKDGSTFGNFERLLPAHEHGYYAEYTVQTPGVDHRGARRIIAGDGGELYWTEDHYRSFARIRR